jgi:hypothetical protein
MSNEPPEPSDAELRAAFEEQLRHISALDVIVQTAVSLVNLAGRRLGLAPGTEQERDLPQVRQAIDATRALLPVLEEHEGAETLVPLRDALSALQLEYAKQISTVPKDSQATPTPSAPKGGEPDTQPAQQGSKAQTASEKSGPGPAQTSGRLWVPGSADR